jgi:poly-gamma-glutamate capsule biosynthesis protein CapA/YwtB (metallophosphatase superfamily)
MPFICLHNNKKEMRLASLTFLLFWITPAAGQDTTRLSILFTGDIMQHDSQIAAAYDPLTKTYNYESCFKYISPILQSADLTIGNLEVTLGGSPYKGYPQFSAPDQVATQLKMSGFDVLVTANNHCVDRGRKGLQRTISVLDTLALLHTGTFVDSLQRKSHCPLLIEKNGITLSLLNYTYGTNGIPIPFPTVVNLIDTALIKEDLILARDQKTDAIIVFMHWGNEYQSLPNAFQKRVAELCFREGAKLVIGAHPHVVQPMEWNKEKDRLIAYSLGNFVSGQRPRYRDGGATLLVELEKIKKDSIHDTFIKQAQYELQWIHKTSGVKSEFYILPVQEFEGDTIVLNTKTARASFDQFRQDSRTLFAKHNVNVTELKRDFHETIFRIVLLKTGVSTDSIAREKVVDFYGLESEIDNEGKKRWLAGKFFDEEIAVKALTEIREQTIYKEAFIIRQPITKTDH